VNRSAVLALFNDQLRRNPAADPGTRVERDEHVTRVVADGDGWNGVLWSDLAAGASAAQVDAVIAAQVSRFAGTSGEWEWKYYSYDQPAGLPERLTAAGFAAEEPEALLVAEIDGLDLATGPPDGVRLVPVDDAEGAAAVVRVHNEVFGGDHQATGAAIVAGLGLRPRPVQAVLAMAGDTPVSAARVEFPAGSDFASLWGGGTLPSWRGRGVFRALVAYRAALARDRGYRYLQVDASPDSRPILRRLGFTELATTTPFIYSSH
jgi:GNAT superfamily N-acetyltransferase